MSCGELEMDQRKKIRLDLRTYADSSQVQATYVRIRMQLMAESKKDKKGGVGADDQEHQVCERSQREVTRCFVGGR